MDRGGGFQPNGEPPFGTAEIRAQAGFPQVFGNAEREGDEKIDRFAMAVCPDWVNRKTLTVPLDFPAAFRFTVAP